ncbi:molybdenum cofactor guanylyltransferase MobA [Marinobacterium weihaiense]|uniref:Molybdenum cofactor guanylyltransferase n=1 Tax=Marinobacterium weihaiense TaxID=2851016 RepID=A0ABS6MEG6_9GAMM|nr:molybdenum cofactor guanylyltransferase MobA [Marinobacterium weihaiense]MBV0934515.1 molybdenum cofactor guanylyltransferase [Marinobacterium weihaiense]
MHDQPVFPDISGVILAGGRGRRMGGCDKGLLPLQGQPLAEHVRQRLVPQVSELCLVANRSLPAYRQLGLAVMPDCLPGQPGPLAGMLTGLQQARHEWVLFSPCDTPWLPPDLAFRLWRAVAGTPVQAVVAREGGQTHWLCCLVHHAQRESLQQALASGVRSAGAWLVAQACIYADFTDCPGAFGNLNTPEELQQAEQGHLPTG